MLSEFLHVNVNMDLIKDIGVLRTAALYKKLAKLGLNLYLCILLCSTLYMGVHSAWLYKVKECINMHTKLMSYIRRAWTFKTNQISLKMLQGYIIC